MPAPRLFLYRLLGFAALALGAAGVVLPGLPATPFLLVAVWAFGRGAPHLARRVEAHPRFGPPLRAWRERGAVPARAKGLAALSMAASLLVLWLGGASALVLALVALSMLGALVFLLSRPSA